MKKIPKLKGLSVEEAKNLLRKKSIKFEEKTRKVFSLFVENGKIVKTKEENEKVVLYESNRNIFLLIGILAVLIVLGLNFTFGNGIYESVKDQIIEIMGITAPPEIETEEGWGKQRIVKITKDAKATKKIKFYEYCIRGNSKEECNWEVTYTKNVVVSKTGKWEVLFRGVDEEGKRGKEASILVYVDNEAPEVKEFKVEDEEETSITVKSVVEDKDSGLAKILYSLDEKNYKEGKDEYTYKDLVPGEEYTLYLKAVDKVGNEKTVSIKVVKKTKEEIEAEKKAQAEKDKNNKDGKNQDGKNQGGKNEDGKKPGENEEDIEWDIPEISLEEVPSVFESGEKYNLPSSYSFGNDNGVVVCSVDDTAYGDTSTIPVGKHTIICVATSNHIKEAKVEKEVLIQAPEGEDELLDGWIKLNLYYPEESYNWKWRYGLKETDNNEEYEDLDWQDYTGPILVKIFDIHKIYIKYDKNGESQIIAPTGTVLVDIEPASNNLTCGGETQVNIKFDTDALTKQYRINGGKWQNYEGPFQANGNTIIEARATKNEDVYNTDGELEYTKLLEGYDRREIKDNCSTTNSDPLITEDPAINLNGIPSIVYMGENISLPSYYTYGSHEAGKVECTDQDGNKVTNTRYLSEGNYKVTCSLTAADGTKIGPVSRRFTIEKREYNPEINLWDLPSTIVKGDNYNLPSNYTYGSHGEGTIVCQDELSNIITNTSNLDLGIHTVSCILTAQDGTTAQTSRNVDVVIGFEPNIDLNNVADILYKGEFTPLPSHYNYGIPSTGVISCTADGNIITNASSLDIGIHYIECKITNLAGLTATTSKTVNVIKKPIIPEPLYEVLNGPVISGNPDNNTLTDQTVVEITPQEEASIIKYSFDGHTWYTYNSPLAITSNRIVYAYYVRKSDGKQSDTSNYRINNIKEKNLPYVRIDATPDYLTQDVNSVEVTISGSDYETLEYSYDGIVYYPYTSPLTITSSKTVYAKGTNQYGSKVEKLTIQTVNPPAIPVEKLNVSISANPNGKQDYIINETEVTINYDSRAENKYYRIGSTGEWQEYTGPFKVRKNTTIYAYATNATLRSDIKTLIVNYLTLGIADPVITVEPASPIRAHKVRVHIDWDTLTVEKTEANDSNNLTGSLSLAMKKFEEPRKLKDEEILERKYKIIYEDGRETEWLDYVGDFEVEENCVIKAYQKDILGNISGEIEIVIDNIVPLPEYITVKYGDYYFIKLNYPSTSEANSRQYKWKNDGEWKTYDPKGIVLLKQEKADKYDLTKDGLEVKDENGNPVTIDMEHVYILDVPLSEMSESIFMRWDNTKPTAPVINFNTENATTEVEVSISYQKVIVEKEYKIVNSDGTDSGWLTYTKPFKVNKNNTTIYARGKNRLEVYSETTDRTITNIDELNPTITLTGNLTSPKQKVNLTVNATDDKMLYMVKWAKGKRNKDYFNENKEDQGTTIKNNSTVQIEENGYYTFYAVDQAGNETIKEIKVTNIDLTAPDLSIKVLTPGVTTQARISIDYGDSVIKEYSIGNNANYKSYTDILTLSSYDYIDLANQDGSLTIYVRGTDEAGNVKEISEDLRCLDLDMPTQPVINASAEYPTLTQYGVEFIGQLSVVYDARTDIINEISLDNGETWTRYTGNEKLSSGTIMARSRKITTGLTTPVVTKTVAMPTETLSINAYDGNNDSYVELGFNVSRQINVDSSMYNKKVHVLFKVTRDANGYMFRIKFYSAGNKELASYDYARGDILDREYTIPEGTAYIQFKGDAWTNDYHATANIYEIYLQSEPEINAPNVYPTITSEGINDGYTDVEIEYFASAIQKLYKIDDGEWQEYHGSFNAKVGQTISAKSIDSKGIESKIVTYTLIAPIDGIKQEAYDGNNSTSQALAANSKAILNVSSSAVPSKIKIRSNSTSESSVNVYGSNDTIIATYIINSTSYEIELPIGTTKVEFIAGSTQLNIYEIVLTSDIEVVEGDSILSIIQNNDLNEGYYNFKVADEMYPVHLIEIKTDTISENKCYGNMNDVGTANLDAENMVIVVRKGDLTIEGNNTTVGPCYDKNYGGPKGFLLYVTGKLTNNGIIDNSHGAKAVGQNVYLWKNVNGTYEYVPAVGASGGLSAVTGKADSGSDGNTIDKRATGGGGASGHSLEHNSGTQGTSYSGGTGGARNNTAMPYGGAGGAGTGQAGGGAGNPGGAAGVDLSNAGANGTGGLLVIYAESFENNGSIVAKGSNGGWGYNTSGGSSGGGSINVFYRTSLIKGSATISGGSAVEPYSGGTPGGAGGAGTITYMKLTPNVVTFNPTGGNVVETRRLVSDTNAIGSLPIPTNSPDYVFGGWYTSEEYTIRVTRDYVPSGDITLYAKWIKKSELSSTTESYSYKNSNQTYIAPKTGLYKLEVWGAQGGKAAHANGGYGGYSIGYTELTVGDTLFVNVGGTGVTVINDGTGRLAAGGYNGGGSAYSTPYTGGTSYRGSGGGATHIAFAKGTLSELSNNKSSILIVAGGGGGAADWSTSELGAGGHAGGYAGANGINGSGTIGTGGNQSNGGSGYSAGSFGQGASRVNNTDWGGAGGGGGYFGGGSGSNNGGAGGGSGYIGSSSLISNDDVQKHMYCYNCATSAATNVNTYTISNGTSSCHNSEATPDCAKEADGYAIITYVGSDAEDTQDTDITESALRQAANVVTANTLADTISKASNPVVSIETKENTKLVSIEKDENYKTEYSLDLGETWIEYTEPFEVAENTVIFTRVVDNEIVLSTSTMTITGIEKTKEEKEESTPEVLPSEPIEKEGELDETNE